VPVGALNLRMAHIRGEGEDMTTDVVTPFRATLQGSHSKGMAEVHETRPRATGCLRDAQGVENVLKGLSHCRTGQLTASEGNEEVRISSCLATAPFEVVTNGV